MSKNSKIKRDKKKTLERKKHIAESVKRLDFSSPRVIQREIIKLFSPDLLTTPQEINDDIIAFCAEISDAPPFFIKSEPEPWSRQGCCDRNVKEYASLHGGNIVCGYRIWYHHPRYIEAERHAIWYSGEAYKDVSFSPDGEQEFLFVADRVDRQAALKDNSPRIRWGKDYDTRRLIEIQEEMEARRHIRKMSDEQAWNTMLSYSDWLNGKRMPTQFAVAADSPIAKNLASA